MASSNPTRFLSSSTDDRALALKMFWGMVIETFQRSTVFYENTGNIIITKTITEGKSWQFPVVGEDPTPEYHTPGIELLGMAYAMTEGTVEIDGILVADYDVPLDQRVLSHFDVMSPLATKLGRSLAKQLDTNLCITGLKASRHYALSGYHSGGNRVNAATTGDLSTAYPVSSAGAQAFRLSATQLARLMDEDHVPETGRYLFISPYIRQVLQQDTTIWSKDYTNIPVDLHQRILGQLAGFNLVVTTILPSTDITTGPTKYHGDFSYNNAGGDTTSSEGWSETIYNDGRPAALALCGASEGQAAIGMVQAGPITTTVEDDARRNTTFMKAQIMCGCGVLCPWCAGEIYVDD